MKQFMALNLVIWELNIELVVIHVIMDLLQDVFVIKYNNLKKLLNNIVYLMIFLSM